ncbi:MAG: ABC transporter ATP-binding protein [Elusimicrobiales bacterium]|nr:ABC transporter ATP-binding protein [Elusimicrobiales bacterium]
MRLEVKGLVKVFPAPLFSGGTDLRALDGADLDADTGVTGVGGANGSGKTTLFKTLAGILEADGGTILAGGAVSGAGRLRQLAAYCPANPRSFYFRLTAAENLRFFGALAGLPPAEAAARAAKLADRVGLATADLERRFDRLSEGNMQKVSLIRAFSRRAPLLLLDEPFRGLDGIACRGLLELIAETGLTATVLVTSHSRELLGAAAKQTLRIEKGRMPPGGTQ